MTPSGRPLIGRTRVGNLFVNTGHGPLGRTLAAGSARLLAALRLLWRWRQHSKFTLVRQSGRADLAEMVVSA